MARRRIYYKWGIPKSVVVVVVALCADYDRRAKAISIEQSGDPVVKRFMEINQVIDNAFADVEQGIRAQLLADLQQGRGYDSSMAAPFIGKNGYYNRKRKVIHDIAVGLRLI